MAYASAPEAVRAGLVAVWLSCAGCVVEPQLDFDHPCDPRSGRVGCGADAGGADSAGADGGGGGQGGDGRPAGRDAGDLGGGGLVDRGGSDLGGAGPRDQGAGRDLGGDASGDAGGGGDLGADLGGGGESPDLGGDLGGGGESPDLGGDLGDGTGGEGGAGGVLDAGARPDAAPVCMPTGPERCGNRVDDDCDGRVDEAPAGAGLGAPCQAGLGLCARAGTLVCAPDGQLRCSAGAGPSRAETCDGLDDDCDGRVDEVEVDARTGIEWVCIAGGTFLMGSPEGVGQADERPQRQVTVPTFRLARTEVTVAQFEVCVAAGACPLPVAEVSCNWGLADRSTHALNCVSWDDAQAFLAWMGGGARLPSESEWEYAARSGGAEQQYPWGDEAASCARAVLRDDNDPECRPGGIRPVCSRPLGHSAQGLCDLSGNVWEWVEDWYGSYALAPNDGRARTEGGEVRAVRGGGWAGNATFVRAAVRDWWPPDFRYSRVGFRPARPAGP